MQILDRHTEFNRHAQRRLEEHLKPIDALLTKWAPEARHDGAPRWPASTMLGRIIEQGSQGASQSGASLTLAAPIDVEFADWAVAQLRDVKRQVIYVEYVNYAGWSTARKRRVLNMSESGWKRNLNGAREIIYTLCQTYGAILNLEIV
jgi:hypothetical protein